MEITTKTTIDSAGRLVVPKAIREQAGLAPGVPLILSVREGRIEIEVAPREVRIIEKGGLHVAEPLEESAPLTNAEVERTRRLLRERPLSRPTSI